MNKYNKDDTINLAYEILNKHIPQTDEVIEFNIVEAMMEFLNTKLENTRSQLKQKGS